jgi:hypothetical protein
LTVTGVAVAAVAAVAAANSMDTDLLLEDACRLLQTMVDVISSNGWLKPALVVMEMSQMTVQGLWGEDSPLLQIPHFTPELVDKCASASVPKRGEDGEEEEGPVESVYDVLELDASVRESLLGLSKPQVRTRSWLVHVWCGVLSSVLFLPTCAQPLHACVCRVCVAACGRRAVLQPVPQRCCRVRD